MAKKKNEVIEETNEMPEIVEELEIEEIEEIAEIELKKENEEMDNRVKLLQKVMNLQKFFDEYKFVVDGYNDNQKYSYIKGGQYKVALRQGCIENGLLIKVNVANRLFTSLEKHEKSVSDKGTLEVSNNKMNLITIQGSVVLTDIDTGEEIAYFCMADGADMLDKGIYKAQTMLIKSFVQMNFLINDGDEDYESNAREKLENKAQVNFVSDSKRSEIKTDVVTDKNMATVQYLESIATMIHAIRKTSPEYAEKILKTIQIQITSGIVTWQKQYAIEVFTKIEERMSEIGLTDLGDL